MKYTMLLDYYSGVDGSSLSEKRCEQIIQIYDMLLSIGDEYITYSKLRDEASKRELFGKTKVANAIRTFFPLLQKIGFVNYAKESFRANECFTDDGKEFVLLCKALENIDELSIHKDEIRSKLIEAKQALQQKGLVNMFNNPDCKSHNMWIALKLIKELQTIEWNEFLFTIYMMKGENKEFEEIVDLIQMNRRQNVIYEFVDEGNKTLPNTCYSYIKAYLIECGIIEESHAGIARITKDGTEFMNILSL